MASDERVERIHRDGVVVDMVTNLLTEGVLRGIDDFRKGAVDLICQSVDRRGACRRSRVRTWTSRPTRTPRSGRSRGSGGSFRSVTTWCSSSGWTTYAPRCAGTGGVIGILAIPLFLTGERSAPFEAFLGHLLHAIEVAGVEHVGLGLDHWYGMPSYADLGWPPVDTRADDGVSDLRRIFWDEPALAGNDVVEGEAAGVMGGNWLRVLAATWR